MHKTSSSERLFLTEKYEAVPLLNLLAIQKDSYNWFLKEGLQELFDEISPVTDFTGKEVELCFKEYYFDKPKFSERTASEKNETFEAPLRVRTQLVNKKTGEIKEQEIYLGDFPLMTGRASFIINGVERVVVSQLIRSPGVFFTTTIHNDKNYYGAKIIPNRGAWLEIETEKEDVIYVKVDRQRKVAVTSLLRALGYGSDEEIKKLFYDVEKDAKASFIENTIKKDPAKNQDQGLIEIYKRIRPGDLATPDNAKSLIYAMFFDFSRYDLGRVGRYKINQRLDLNISEDKKGRVFHREDLVSIIKEIIRLNITQDQGDDIDHLGNRRVRAVGELVQNRFRIGLARMERIAKDRMSTLDLSGVTPSQLINARPVVSSIREFFMSSQLSQFMDQTNPLSELEHKRRLSAMGPGGLKRKRAGFDVRDVHRSHYGRICPIATPEGPNIGLVGHMACYARLNKYGFIEAPFLKVLKNVDNKKDKLAGHILDENIKIKTKIVAKKNEVIDQSLAQIIIQSKQKKVKVKHFVSQETIFLDAFLEEKHITAPSTVKLDQKGHFLEKRVYGRIRGETSLIDTKKIDLLDVSSKQIISLTTSLIPFLEHDDANRALMGTNMQRQAVPCIQPEAPLVGTGAEKWAALNSGRLITAKNSGKAINVSADRIQILEKKGFIRDYKLNKFLRSNASTCINQKTEVQKGDIVRKNDLLASGPGMEKGELALGQNLLVAFMAWEGNNFEDAIVISERIVHQDRFSSIHIENFSLDVRETKLGPEIVTRDIPNVGEEKLKDLDAEGIVRIGAEVSSSDILAGKVSLKGESDLSAEERLLRAIFGEEAKDVKDTSLYLQHGERGKVVDVKIFSRDQGDRLASGIIKTIQVSVASLRKVQIGDKLSGRHGNKGVIAKILPQEEMPFLKDGTPIDIILSPLGVVSRMNIGQVLETHLGWAAKTLGYKVASAVFCSLSEEMIKQELEKAGLPRDGQVPLYDGRTGESFEEKVTVGYAYIMKLHHLVEDKIHQRSIGPYSLVTQQPLGGKAQFGGQRFGEMEVWALEGYGAAYTLQEMLTIKSDDVAGRSKTYEAIIKNEEIKPPHVPESFNVLVKELKSLGFNVELVEDRRK